MANNKNDRIKVAGYARRIFFNDNIEYRNFSPDLVGLQFTSDGGTALFTNGNFTISTNLDPKPNVVFTQGTKSKLFILDDVIDSNSDAKILNNIQTQLNLDLSNPLTYIWYGSASELIRASLEEIQSQWPAAIYVDNKVGDVSGDNIVNYVYDIVTDQSTFTVNSRFFINPYGITYTEAENNSGTVTPTNPLRNFTVHYKNYTIEHNGIIKNIKSITPTSQITNADLELVVEGNPFPELTGILIPQFTFLFTPVSASIPFFIKPNETQKELFFSNLNNLQRNLLNRETYPDYKSIIISQKITDSGVVVTVKEVLIFPVLEDGYNLNFFDGFYISYLNTLNTIGENYDESQTDLIVRKYTAEAISSFDTLPSGDGNNIILDGEKATKLLRIYGVAFDEVKKYINGLKFAHTVTYNKENNIPDVLVKDLSFMLGLDPVTFVTQPTLGNTLLPSSKIGGKFSGTSKNYSAIEMDIELYRRLILNIAWVWKSKGTRKAIEFLFRFIGAPESLVKFNEYIVVVDEPLNMDKIKELLYIYTGDANTDNIPYDDDGFPLPPQNGELVITNFISNTQTGSTTTLLDSAIEEGNVQEMYFQKAGGWYRETFGGNGPTILTGNNPHSGPYDGGNEYLNYFSQCYIPNFTGKTMIDLFKTVTTYNAFINYNEGIFNNVPDNSQIFTEEIIFNINTGGYQPIENCLDIEYTLVPTPLQVDGHTTLQNAYLSAQTAFDDYTALIQQNPYLQYSQEWADIQSTLSQATTDYGHEVSSQEYDPGVGLVNKTLEICLTPSEETEEGDHGIIKCDEFQVVELDEFIYFTNFNGDKQKFNGIAECCNKNEGNWLTFYDGYYNIDFCVVDDPCTGNPIEVDDNGIVVFEVTGNIMPDNIITIHDKCYQFDENCLPQDQGGDGCVTDIIYPTFNTPAFHEWVEDIYGTAEFFQCFTEVNCGNKTIVSSPPCCLYYGYTPIQQTIVHQGEIIKYYVCVDEASPNTPNDLSYSTLTYVLPALTQGYSELLPGTNTNATVNQVSEIYQSSTVLPIVGYYNSTYINPPTLNSYFLDPDLNNPGEWELESVDDQGRLSFYAYDDENNKVILDWNYPDNAGSGLYQQVVVVNGYTISEVDGVEVGIDPNFIPCEDIDDVTIVLGAENYQGFKLPTDSDCSCSVIIDFDYMLKYEASNLIDCAEVICFPAVFSHLTETNINCKNFITFTNNEEDSSFLLQNYDPLIDQSGDWVEVDQVEPNIECCQSFGGEVVSLEMGADGQTEWGSLNTQWISQIKEIYNGLFDGSTNTNTLNTDLLNVSINLQTVNTTIDEIINSGCIDFTPYTPPVMPCPYDYSYFTTETICALPLNEECGLWTMILQDYKNKLEWAYSIQIDLEACITAQGATVPNPQTNIVGDDQPPRNILEGNEFNNNTNTEVEDLDEQIDDTILLITGIGGDVTDLNNENNIIDNALTQTETETDCTVYETQLKIIDNFNTTNYCENNIIITNPERYGIELNNCKETKQLQLDEEKIKYTQLFNLCNKSNDTNLKLKEAQYQNQEDRINLYSQELIVLDDKINTITKSLNNEVINKSAAQAADQVYVIEIVATILDVNEKSITTNGDLDINESQKIQLQIQKSQNNQVITNKNRELGELNQQLTNLRNSKDAIINQNTNNQNLGNRLLTIGGAIIGTALLAKGYLDPESASGLILGIQTIGVGIGPPPPPHEIRGCPDPTAQNYKYGANRCPTNVPQYVAGGSYTQAIENGNCVMVNGCCRKSCGDDPGDGSDLDNDYDVYDLEPNGASGAGGGHVGDVDPDDEIIIGDVTPTTCEFCLAQPNDMAGATFGPGLQPYEGQNPVFDNTGNYHTLSQECCNEAVVGLPVGWFTDWSGAGWCITTDLGINFTNGEELANQRADCIIGLVDCMDGTTPALNYNPNATIPCAECCLYESGGDGGTGGDGGNGGSEDIVGCMDENAINYDEDATIDCGLECCLYTDPCCEDYLKDIIGVINFLESQLPEIEKYTEDCYMEWNTTITTQFNNYIVDTSDNYLNYIDDLKLNFKLFVDNSNSAGGNAINSSLSLLPYTDQYNPIWEWNPNQQYSGIFIEGSDVDVAEVEGAIFNDLSLTYPEVSMNTLFEPQWKTMSFTIKECVCDKLRTLYPSGQFYLGLEIENYECSVCLYIDNIRVNVTDCQIDKTMVLNNCLIPQLSCIIDNKKSWVYTSDGIKKETIYPNGSCNKDSEENYTINRMIDPINRYWEELEYRYTDYDINHSDLVINTKSATFAIDPANAIECDVYNFWRQINCEECPTACESGGTVTFDGKVFYSASTLGEYELELSGTTTAGLVFSCETYTNILTNQVLELKNDYYIATADLAAAKNATYNDLLHIGGNLSLFEKETNNCNSENIIIGNNKRIDNLFGILVEEPDSTISFWETYIYSASTPFSGGRNIEIFSGITAQTFNQTTSFDKECCESISKLITDRGVNGLGIDKNYTWNNSVNACTWLEIDNCEGDCAYSGVKNVNLLSQTCVTGTSIFDIVVTGTSTGTTTGYTAGYCIAPYSATPAGDSCEYIVSSAATYTGVDFTAYTGSKTSAYSVNGTRWYGIDLNTSALPYKLTTSTSMLDDNNVVVPVIANNTTSALWDSLGSSGNGRLNGCGIWATNGAPATNPPLLTWLGFSRCIQIDNAGTYTIGLAADNRTRFYIDGTLMFTSAGLSGMANYDLSVWKIFELELTSGEHIIEMEGYNYNAEASFGAEVYSATTGQLTGMTTTGELDAVTIFTTKDYRSDVVGSDFLFDFGSNAGGNFGFSCPDGWSFAAAPCYASASCVKLSSTGLTYDITGTTTSTTTSTTVTVTGITTTCTPICGVTGQTTCINPLDYLDVPPSEITVKEVFDEMVLSNLIDAKSRQVISNYPLLLMFYQQYLNASNCGKKLTAKLDYNNLFEFMDKIGDYWLDLLEQAVPATTIWEGCDNSGKLYRNTIFHQNKYPYRRYTLNFNDTHDCAVSGITNNSIGESNVDVIATNLSLYPTNETLNTLMSHQQLLSSRILRNEERIKELEKELCVCNELGPDALDSGDYSEKRICIDTITKEIFLLQQSIDEDNITLSTINSEISEEQNTLLTQQQVFQSQYSDCEAIATQLTEAMQALEDDFTPGTVEYERQRNFIAGIRHQYKKCMIKNNTQISNYNSVFITQIYASNEYEGTVTVTGDPDWSPGNASNQAGPFYNTGLIHNCE